MEWHAGTIPYPEAAGLLLVAGCLAFVGACTLLVPKFVSHGRTAVLAILFSYFQLTLYGTLFHNSDAINQYGLNRSAQLMSLLYLASYALVVRKTLLLPILHCSLIIAQGLFALSTENTAHQFTPESRQVLHLIVISQPIYIALLVWINMQRQQAIAMQQQAVTSKLTTLGMISHELRSPLQTIVGSIEALEQRFVEWNLPKNEYRNLGRIRFSAAQLDSYLSDLLIMTRQGTGQIALEASQIDLHALLKDILHSYDAAAADRGNSLDAQIAEDCRHVLGDKVRVHQVLNNLLSNAVKYTRDGEISINVSRPDGGDLVEFEVKDTGIGIAEHKLAEIWRPYIRIQRGDVRPEGGSGLGLAVVRVLIAILGGEVAVASELGKGSTFTVRLPLPCNTSSRLRDFH